MLLSVSGQPAQGFQLLPIRLQRAFPTAMYRSTSATCARPRLDEVFLQNSVLPKFHFHGVPELRSCSYWIVCRFLFAKQPTGNDRSICLQSLHSPQVQSLSFLLPIISQVYGSL